MKSHPYTGIPGSNVPKNLEPTFVGAIIISLICASFGANAAAIKISLTGLGVFTAATIRFIMGSTAIALWALMTGRSMKLKNGQLKPIFFVTFCFIFQISLYNVGLKLTQASRGTLMSNLQPFFVMILAHFFIPGDRITLKKIIGISLGFSGVAVLFLQKEGITSDLRTGDLLTLGSVIMWAVNAVYTKKIVDDYDPFHLVLYPGILAVPVFICEAFLWDSPMIGHVDYHIVWSMLYQGLVTAAVGFVAWMELLKRYGAVALHSYVFILPVAGVFSGGLILREPVLTVHMLTSLALIVTGIVIVHGHRKKLETQ